MAQLGVNGSILYAATSSPVGVSTAIGHRYIVTIHRPKPIAQSLPCVLHGSDDGSAALVRTIGIPKLLDRASLRARQFCEE